MTFKFDAALALSLWNLLIKKNFNMKKINKIPFYLSKVKNTNLFFFNLNNKN